MKKYKCVSLAFLIFNFSYAQQRDVNNNLYVTQSENVTVQTIANSRGAFVPVCSGQNTFWGLEFLSGNYIAKEFDLTNNTVTYTGNFVPLCANCSSLAISNNLNGGAFSPTFYTSYNNQVFYYDGSSSLIPCNSSPVPYCHCNAAGNNNNLYFHYQNAPSPIIKFDGTTYTTIFSINKGSGIADIAIDNFGNIYYVSRDAGPPMADSLYIISPGGQILNQYSLAFNLVNAYGCFLLNNVFYIGFGSSHPVYPNTLVPVTISGTNAIMGTPVDMPLGFDVTGDLASCNPGSLLGIDSNYDLNKDFNVFPNPVSSKLIVSFKDRNIKGNVEILNLIGEAILKVNVFNESKKEINVENMPAGIYFVKVYDGDKSYCRKLIIE